MSSPGGRSFGAFLLRIFKGNAPVAIIPTFAAQAVLMVVAVVPGFGA